MNIEEAIEILKKEPDYSLNYYNRENAIDALLTAYENLKSYNKGTKEALRVAEELEHQANKEAGDWEARCFELKAELEKEKEKNKKIENELEKYIKFCEQEAEGSLNNEICHIALKFNKGLLDIINEEE